jgi:hypothetical protein
MLALLVMLIVFSALAALFVRFGVDSRVESDDRRRSTYQVGIN